MSVPMPGDAYIVIQKKERILRLSTPAGLEHAYPVVLGRNCAADKEVEGDHATPLGEFYVCAKNPRSKYFLSLCLSYPNAEHARRGLAAGLLDADEYVRIMEAIGLGKMPPQHTRLGGEIYIHGFGPDDSSLARQRDWTRGCIAVQNAAMRLLYDSAHLGMVVRIIP